MSKNIVVLSGSPRKDGNTDKLTAAFIDGAESSGKKVTLFRVADMKINGCFGCEHCCEEKGVCVQKDDMVSILDALQNADTLVLASPVYYFTITAQLKLALDRTFALNGVRPSVKRTALLMTSGDDDVKVADGAVVMYRNICAFCIWEDAGVIIAGGLHGKDDIVGRNELDKARSLGREI